MLRQRQTGARVRRRSRTTSEDARLFEELYPALRRFAAVVRPPDVDADDLVQEALLRTLQVRSLAECTNPGAYLRTAIVHAASNHRRRFARANRSAVALAGGTRADDTYPSDLDDLRRLPVRDRTALYLAVVEGASHREIAAVLDCSEVAARARVMRALRRLRAELHEEDGDARVAGTA